MGKSQTFPFRQRLDAQFPSLYWQQAVWRYALRKANKTYVDMGGNTSKTCCIHPWLKEQMQCAFRTLLNTLKQQVLPNSVADNRNRHIPATSLQKRDGSNMRGTSTLLSLKANMLEMNIIILVLIKMTCTVSLSQDIRLGVLLIKLKLHVWV